MRPLVTTLASKICAVAPVAEGYAATMETGIALVSPALAPIATIGAPPGFGEVWGACLRELADGRFVCCARDGEFGAVLVGRRGGTMERVTGEHDYAFAPLATRTGFAAPRWQAAEMIVDEAGARHTVALPVAPDAAIACGERWALLHETRLVLVDTAGTYVAGRDVPQFSTLLGVFGGALAIRTSDETIELLDQHTLATREAIAHATKQRAPLLAHGDAIIRVGDDAIELPGAWRVRATAPTRVLLAGDFLVVDTESVDADVPSRARVIELATGTSRPAGTRNPSAATPFGGGLVIVGSPAIWWRPDHAPVELVHDFTPKVAATVAPTAAITADRRQLYLWRTDADGPELPPIATTVPFDVPIIADGSHVVVKEARRFSLICDLGGSEWPIAPDVAWRYPLEPADARAIVDRLLARDLAGDIPDAVRGATEKALIVMAPTSLVPLIGRVLFDRASLDDEQRAAADRVLVTFLGEVAGCLKLRPRALYAALRAGTLDARPPRALPGYDYLGAFTTGGTLWVADPCYYNQRSEHALLATTLAARPGTWHAFVRGHEPTEELVAVHADAFEVSANKRAGSFGVDAGCGGVFDDACAAVDLDHGVLEAIQPDARGVVAHSGHGDGMYAFYTGRLGKQVAKIRLGFQGGTGRDRAVPVEVPEAGRAYSAKQRFAVGEAIEHPKFGMGTVKRAGDTTMEVAFAEGARTLAHAKAT